MANSLTVRTPYGNAHFKSAAARDSYLADSGIVATPVRLADDFTNFVSGLGGANDIQSYSGYFTRELTKAQIDSSVRTSWISAKLHSIIPTDAIRAGWCHKADDVDITLIESEQRRLQVNIKLRMALYLARKYGGSIIYMGVGTDDPSMPLAVDRIRKGDLRYLHVLSRHMVTMNDIILDPGSEFYGHPKQYLINAGNGNTVSVHPSRVIRFLSTDACEEELQERGGWSDPLLMSLWSAIVNSDTSQAAMAHLLNKMKVDTLTIPGLSEIFATQESEDRFKRRLTSAALFEGLLGIKLIGCGTDKDSPTEKWETFQLNLSGMPELNNMFLQMCAGAGDTPYTRLVGKSAEGMSATGEGDDRNYQITIKSLQELNLRPRHEQLNEVLYRSALGGRPDSLWYEYNPLFVQSDKEKAENALKRAQATVAYADSGLVPADVLAEAVKSQLIESGEYPGIEQAYREYGSGTLEGIAEEDGPLIPVDETGAPRLNRDSRLFAANDMVARMLADGKSAVEATKEAHRLLDAEPRPVYVSRRLINAQKVREHFEAQGLKVTVANDRQHVTVIYSKAPVDWFKAAGGIWNSAELIVPAGGPRMMDRFGPNANAIVLMFSSGELQWRHRELLEAGCSHDFDYHCHITLDYSGQDIDLDTIQPYKGELRFSYEDWQEIQEDWSKS